MQRSLAISAGIRRRFILLLPCAYVVQRYGLPLIGNSTQARLITRYTAVYCCSYSCRAQLASQAAVDAPAVPRKQTSSLRPACV